jgi:hypothetical protein
MSSSAIVDPSSCRSTLVPEIDLTLQQEVPDLIVEPTLIFNYPTALVDVYSPAVEQIYQPAFNYQVTNAVVNVASSITHQKKDESWRRKTLHQVAQLFHAKEEIVDCSGQFIFDTRWEQGIHIGHVLQKLVTPLLYAQKLLSEHLGKEIKMTAIVSNNAPKIACQVYQTLGISIIQTNAPVYGHVVSVRGVDKQTQEERAIELCSVQHDLFRVDFEGYIPDTPERVFIPRRGNRRLINQDEVQGFLEQRGFTTFYFEDLTPSQEWSITRNAKVVVALHGAACDNLLFNSLDSGLRLIEIFSPQFTMAGCYRYIPNVRKGKWCGVRGQLTPAALKALDFDQRRCDTHKSPFKDPIRVSLASLEMALDYLEVA